ncbi:hypothetical protein QTO34_016371 [Cnephaeus nilssonii]|uniref:Cytohesin-3 n=1 Tax=Cnephaeus nilssonii TaxID=3371016 RepID=A0AA40LRL8_CNENI|nr:hypothetical protein QTO34_016371 [Eptesicus nilssonii]
MRRRQQAAVKALPGPMGPDDSRTAAEVALLLTVGSRVTSAGTLPSLPVGSVPEDLSSEEREELLDIRRRKKELIDDIERLKYEIAEVMTEIDNLTSVEESKTSQRNKHIAMGRKKFNMDPKKGIQFLVEKGLLQSASEDVAQFLYKGEGLNKTVIGDYLGERDEFNIKVLQAFVELHEFADLNLVQALRQFLWSFRLPGEAQKIDRMMEAFASRYCLCNPGVFQSTDTCYVLSFAIIMLNTSLHNHNVRDKPTAERFVTMNRGINEGGDLPEELLRVSGQPCPALRGRQPQEGLVSVSVGSTSTDLRASLARPSPPLPRAGRRPFPRPGRRSLPRLAAALPRPGHCPPPAAAPSPTWPPFPMATAPPPPATAPPRADHRAPPLTELPVPGPRWEQASAKRPLLLSSQNLYESIKNEPFKIPEDDGNDLTHTFFNPDREGWLLKLGGGGWGPEEAACGRVKTWKRRWFILTDNCLYYFEYTTVSAGGGRPSLRGRPARQPVRSLVRALLSQDKEPRGIIPLENLSIREVEDPRKPHCFELYNPSHKGQVIKACKTEADGRVVEGNHVVYRISAPGPEEKEEWMKSIRASISRDPFYDMLATRKRRIANKK